MSAQTAIVFVVDDDADIRDALRELLDSHGILSMSFGSAGDYVRAEKPDTPACLVLDVELPDISGLELQKQFAQAEHPPIVFLTGHGDIPSSVRAIKHGAVDFLTKPVAGDELIAAINAAIAQDVATRLQRADLDTLRKRHASLTPRERQVLALVVSGLLNKQAAAHLGIRDVTLELHRRNAMKKMVAVSFADLVRMAERLGIPIIQSRRLPGDHE